jgi:alpha/beta superfamily hydrolase
VIRAGLLAIALLAPPALAQDYAREKRWAEEFVPAVVVGDVVRLSTTAGREFLGIYTRVAPEKGALVIVHGIGVHPDHGVIGVLRTRLADLGYTTLSIQMPVQAADARSEAYYPAVFPEARDRIGAAAAWLAAHGHGKLALVTHSMGSWMANDYLDATREPPYAAWVCLGLTGGFSWKTWFSTRPILDVYGENDLPPALAAAWRRRVTLATAPAASRQVMIPGADHFYAGQESVLAASIAGWLQQALP